jgi:hypothetical protein
MQVKYITGKTAFFAMMISVDFPSMFRAINNELPISQAFLYDHAQEVQPEESDSTLGRPGVFVDTSQAGEEP